MQGENRSIKVNRALSGMGLNISWGFREVAIREKRVHLRREEGVEARVRDTRARVCRREEPEISGLENGSGN